MVRRRARPKRYGRAVLELVGVLAVGTSYYWIVPIQQARLGLHNIRDRPLNVEVKFDNNMFRTNFLLHPLAGTMSYWLARADGLTFTSRRRPLYSRRQPSSFCWNG